MAKLRRKFEIIGSRLESYVIQLISKHLNPNERESIIIAPSLKLKRLPDVRADVYLPKGIESTGINCPIMIEIKGSILLSSFYQYGNIAGQWLKCNPDGEFWLIYRESYISKPKISNTRFRFISIDELSDLLNDKTYATSDLTANLGQVQIDEIDQSVLIKKARESLVKNNCTIVLGAGISIDAGAKSWNNLLQSLLQSSIEHTPLGQNKDDFNDVNRCCGWSSLITARYIMRFMEDTMVIPEIRKILYTRLPNDHINKPSALFIIARLIKQFNIESVITFNYDQFLEEALEKIDVSFMPFVGKGETHKKELPIYHVHGMVSRNDDGPTELPVLSEREYHALYADAFHWANIELVRAFTRNTCFFIGLSMTDPNLRRLLDIAKIKDDKSIRHYIFMRKEPVKAGIPNHIKDNKHWAIIENQFRELGLNIIWYNYNEHNPNDHSDLKTQLYRLIGVVK